MPLLVFSALVLGGSSELALSVKPPIEERCCRPAFISIPQNNGCWIPCTPADVVCDGFVWEQANPGACYPAEHGTCACCTTTTLTKRKLNCVEDSNWCDPGESTCVLVDSGSSAREDVDQCNGTACP